MPACCSPGLPSECLSPLAERDHCFSFMASKLRLLPFLCLPGGWGGVTVASGENEVPGGRERAQG
eukprot:2271847-Heterocapsa_arctica.AAC.1